MKKGIVFLGIAVVFVTAVLSFADEVRWEEVGGANPDINTILLHPEDPDIIYIGSRNFVLKTGDSGKTWSNILSVKGAVRRINLLAFGPQDKNYLYALTGNGLYFSLNRGGSWKRIFRGKNIFENECTSIAVLPEIIFLGTKAGLFVSKDKGISWHKEKARLSGSAIKAIACNLINPDYIYVACLDGVFKTENRGESWERVFTAAPVEDRNGENDESDEKDEEESSSDVEYISVDTANPDIIYLATAGGIHKSIDKGKTWAYMTASGLLSRRTSFILSQGPDIFTVANSGVFKYAESRWLELSLGLAVEKINFLCLDKENNLFAACDKGLFKAKLEDATEAKQPDLLEWYCEAEPDIRDIQLAAVKYAEVGPEKIAEWRRKAKARALLPKLTIGLDRSEDSNYEIYTSSTTRYVYEGPNDESCGWDITLAWDLSDLVWNESQTSIDVRSRLNTQLRDDILDEVTKIYFERIRIKAELDNLQVGDKRKEFEKKIRLQELTAYLDGLTGGYFSKQGRVNKGG